MYAHCPYEDANEQGFNSKSTLPPFQADILKIQKQWQPKQLL